MQKYFRLFEALKKIYGSKFVSNLFGKKRTNLIKLPPKEAKRFVKKELNIAEAGDKAVELGKKDLAELVLDVKQIEKLNDQELLTLTNNAERMAQRISPEAPVNKIPSSGRVGDVIDMKTQEIVPPEGIASLTEKAGQKAPPGTLMGNLESRIKQLEASGEDLSKMKGQTLDDIMRNEGQAQKGIGQLQKEGLVKATANDIMIADMKSGKFPATKEMQQEILEGSPKSLDYFRRFYGEDALEVLDSLGPDLAKMRTSREAADFAKKQYNFEPKMDRAPGSIDLDDAKKAEDEFGITSLKNPSEAYKPFGSDFNRQEKVDWLIKNVDPEAEVTIPSPGALQNMLDSGREDLIDHFWEIHTSNIGRKPVVDIDTSDLKNPELVRYMMEKEARKLKLVDPDKKGINSLKDDIDDPEEFAVGGRVGFRFGTPKKIYNFLKKLKKENPKRQLTDDEIEDLLDELNQGSDALEAYSFDGTVGDAQKILKENKAYEAQMFTDYKAGRLDPKPGEKGRKEFLEKKMEEMEMSGDRKLMTPDEIEELEELKQINRRDTNVFSETYLKKIDDEIIDEGLYTRKEWAKAPETIKNKIRGQMDPDWKEANFGNDYDFDQVRGKELEEGIGGLKIDMNDVMDDVRLMKEKGLQSGKAGDYDKFLEMKLSGELGPQKQMQTIKMELFNKYSKYLDDETMDVIQASDDPQKVAEAYANVREAALLSDRGVPTEEIVDTIIKAPRTKQADGTGSQGLNYLLGF